MNKYKKGDNSNFSFGKKITDVEDVDFTFIRTNDFGICENCGYQLTEETTYHIIKLLTLDKGKYYVGYSDEGHTLKISEEERNN